MGEKKQRPDHCHSRMVTAPHVEFLMCSETFYNTRNIFFFQYSKH